MNKALFLTILLCFTSTLSNTRAHSFEKNGYNCLEAYYGKPEELLSVDLVGKFVDYKGASAEAEKVSEQIIRDKDMAQVNCKWRIDGQRHIVRLSQIFQIELYKSKTAVERFYSKYHTRTEEEIEALKEVYDKEVTEKVNSENSEAVTTAQAIIEKACN